MKQGWEIKSFGELADIKGGKRVPKGYKLETETSNYPYIRVTDFNDNGTVDMNDIHYINEQVFRQIKNYTISKKDLYISIAGTIGKTGIIPDELDGSNLTENACKLVFKKDIEPRFVYYFTKSNDFLKQAGLNTRVAAMPKLALTRLSTISLFIPNSLSEQQRIVAILDEAFTSIAKAKANAEQNLLNSKELFDSNLQSVFATMGDGWSKLKLLDLMDRGWITSHLDGNHGGEYPRKEEFIKEGIPYISANCIKNNSVDLTVAKFLSHDRAMSIRKGVAINNDVLFAHNATVGPVAILKTKEPKVILSTSLTYYRCNTEYILPEYLAHYMRSGLFKIQYELVMRQSTRNQVPITTQRGFIHYIPPMSVQKNLIQKLDALSAETKKLETIYQKKLNDLEELKKSVLQKAFNGELKTI